MVVRVVGAVRLVMTGAWFEVGLVGSGLRGRHAAPVAVLNITPAEQIGGSTGSVGVDGGVWLVPAHGVPVITLKSTPDGQTARTGAEAVGGIFVTGVTIGFVAVVPQLAVLILPVVIGPTYPLFKMPFADWNDLTAAWVKRPKYPVGSELRYP